MKRLAEGACTRQPEMVPTACLSRLEVHNLGQMPQPPVQTEEFRKVENASKPYANVTTIQKLRQSSLLDVGNSASAR